MKLKSGLEVEAGLLNITPNSRIIFTSEVPQSHISSLSLIPFPHTGSATVTKGSLPRQLSRLSRAKALRMKSRLQLLHIEGRLEWKAAMMQLPVGSSQVQVSEVQDSAVTAALPTL